MSAADRLTRRWREARVAAGPALRRRAARRRGQLVLALRVVAVLAVVAVVAAVVFGILDRRGASARERGEQAQAGARAALQTMLSADPRKPDAYVDAVLAVSAGSQRARIEAARAELSAEIAAQSGPSTGQVVATALVDEPSPSGPVTVLVVAEATNPELIGADTTAKRVPVVVTMTQVDGRWLVEQARQA